MSVAKLVTTRKLVSAMFSPNWTSRRITSFTFICETAAERRRVAFTLAACLGQSRSGQFFSIDLKLLGCLNYQSVFSILH